MRERIENTPPRLPAWLFEKLTSYSFEYGARGDLDEDFRRIAVSSGFSRAKAWYWMQVIQSFPRYGRLRISWGMTMLKNYLIITVRNLKKHRIHSLVNLSGMTIGLACTIMILLWVQDELRYDRFHARANRIFRVSTKDEKNSVFLITSPAPLADVIRKEVPEVQQAVRLLFRDDHLLKIEDRVFHDVRGVFADPAVLEVFSYPLIQGDPGTALSETGSILLTLDLARLCFGDVDPLGRMMEIGGDLVKVTGILENIPRNTDIRFEYIRPLPALRELVEYRAFIWNWFALETYVLLDDDVQKEIVDLKIGDMLNSNRPWIKNPLRSFLEPMTRIHLYRLGGGGPVRYVIIFSMVAGLILFIACINFINLSTALSFHRAREVGLRKVSGSNRIQIVTQFFTESLCIVTIAMLFGLVLVQIMLPWFNRISGKVLSLIDWDWSAFAGIMGITMLTGLIAGSYPALVISSFQPARVLKGTLTPAIMNRSSAVFRKSLVILQFTCAIVLMIGAVVVYQQLHFMKTADLGFDKENLIVCPLPDALKPKYAAIKNELLQCTSVEDVTVSGRIGNGGAIEWEGMPQDEGYMEFLSDQVTYLVVDCDYVPTLRIPLIQGRNFSPDFSSDPQNAYLVNEEAVKRWGLVSPVGTSFTLNGTPGTIVGVYQNTHLDGLRRQAAPEVLYLTLRTQWDGFDFLSLRLVDGRVRDGLAFIEEVWNRYGSDVPPEVLFWNDRIDRNYRFEYKLRSIINGFTLLAVVISCLGLFGMASYLSQIRTKEIGIRKVLGASFGDIWRILTLDFGKGIVLANILSWPIAFLAMQRWLQDYPYRVSISVWLFPAVGFSTLMIALITVAYQSIKSATADPIRSLRNE